MKQPDISFAIGIPTLNRWDLLRPSLIKYAKDFPSTRIFVLDNGQQQCDLYDQNIFYVEKPKANGVAGSWNKLCNLIFSQYTRALILNDDIYLGKTESQIKELIASSTGKLLTTLQDFSAFILPKTTFEMVGPFDENFKCYYEDSDYIYRLKLKGYSPVRMATLTPAIYRDNSTSEKEPAVHKWALASKQYYIKKWGGLPGQEKYLSPFNEKLKK